MVHLTPDSRLLVSLVKQEQTYAAQLHNLLNASGASLSALAVYASSSPPTVSPILNGVAGAFSGADEAFRTYGEALNDWIDQLGRIKQTEEEVTNIGRDREILVTRLLKVSQRSKSPPPSLLHVSPDSSSHTSLPTFNSKMNTAQAELRACETRLAEKEQELERVRVHAITQGLALRCGALTQCGQVWSEMGRRALEMLKELNGIKPPNGHATEFFKPLPDPTRDHDRDSVLSSLSPSQSASQIGAVSPLPVPLPPDKPYRLDIPPPHLVSDANVIPQTSGGEASSSSEDEGPVVVYENPRFKPSPTLNRTKKSNWITSPAPARYSPVPFPGYGSDLGASNKLKSREKKRSGLFGNLAALFRTSMTPKSEAQHDGWSTRTDNNLRSIKTDGEQSSDEEGANGRLRKNSGRLTVATFGRTVPAPSDGDGVTQRSDLGGSSPTPRTRRSGKLGRNSTIRSTVSEPASAPRPRANTLSTVPSELAASSGGARNHGRVVSMDGRRGLTSTGTDTAYLQTWKPPKAKRESLMKIMEGPTTDDDLSSRLEVVRAPSNAVPRLPLLVHPPPPLTESASAPSSPVTSKAAATKRASTPVPTITTPRPLNVPAPPSVPEKKPLRSAMRKSPSPSASPNVGAATDDDQSSAMTPLSLPAPSSMSPRPRPVSLSRREIPSTIMESPRQSFVDTRRESHESTKTGDTASISSYETGHESLDEEDRAETERHTPTPSLPPPPPPPPTPASQKVLPPSSPHGPTFHGTGPADQHELSSTTSTDTGAAAPARRKSVRMSSLPPQVSATPPALEEYHDVDRTPWSNQPRWDAGSGWNTRIPTHEVAMSWVDSSSEDETYKEARRALTRANRRAEKKHKGRAS